MSKVSPTSPDSVRRIHPHAWLWEPLESDPTFVVRSMFGAKAVYLDGKIVLCFCATAEPWLGVLVATDQPRHAALLAEFPELVPHPILPKWLYLAESVSSFERIATRIVALARRRDPRLGVVPKPRKTRTSPGRDRRPAGRP